MSSPTPEKKMAHELKRKETRKRKRMEALPLVIRLRRAKKRGLTLSNLFEGR